MSHNFLALRTPDTDKLTIPRIYLIFSRCTSEDHNNLFNFRYVRIYCAKTANGRGENQYQWRHRWTPVSSGRPRRRGACREVTILLFSFCTKKKKNFKIHQVRLIKIHVWNYILRRLENRSKVLKLLVKYSFQIIFEKLTNFKFLWAVA